MLVYGLDLIGLFCKTKVFDRMRISCLNVLISILYCIGTSLEGKIDELTWGLGSEK